MFVKVITFSDNIRNAPALNKLSWAPRSRTVVVNDNPQLLQLIITVFNKYISSYNQHSMKTKDGG